jgi:DNA-binding NarL/FixJ family response regulator
MKKILIVDDHPVIRIGIGELICNNFPGYTYSEAEDDKECIQLVRKENFDLIILDINIPNTNILDLIDWLMIHNSESKILICTMYPYTQYGIQYYKKGVMGYINKEADKSEILRAVDLILNNRIYMSQEFQDTVSDFLTHKKEKANFTILSEREFAVAQCLARGMQYEDIAKALNASTSTIRTFKVRIFRKLGVKTLYDFLTLVKNDNTLGS